MEAAIAGFPLKMSVAWLCPKPRTSKCLCFSKVTVIFLHSASVHTRCGANSHQNRNPLIRTNCKVYVKLTTPRNQFAKCNAIRRIGSHVKKGSCMSSVLSYHGSNRTQDTAHVIRTGMCGDCHSVPHRFSVNPGLLCNRKLPEMGK